MKKKLTILAVLVLTVAMSAYSVAGTYAKYTTSENVTDNARVAKWGLAIGANTEDVKLFDESYIASNADGSETDVASANGDKVIAPGTTGSYAFKFTGSPEVNYTVAVADNGSAITKDVNTNLADALKFQITDGTNASNWVSITDLATTLNSYFNSKVYAANTSIGTVYTINWKWDIEVADNAETVDVDETKVQDDKDTALGNATTDIPRVDVKLKITATQSELKATA